MSIKNLQYNQLKEELLSILQEQQSQLYEEMEKKVKESNVIIEENKRIIECFLEQKYQIDKIENLEKISNKTNDTLVSHEIKIANNSKELSSMKIKYDKMILDNLMVAGLIGPSCQYNNFSSYIKYQISEFNRMKLDNENVKKETKDFRLKIDGMSKNIIDLIDGGVLRCYNYSDNRINDFHAILENKIKEMNDKIMEMRMKNIQFQSKVEEHIKNLKEQYEQKMIKQKDDLSQIINNKIEYLNMNYSSLEKNPKILEMENEIKNNHSQLEKETKEIKEIKLSIQNIKNEVNNNNFNYTSYNSINIHGDYKNKQNKKQYNNYKTNQEKPGNPKKIQKNESNKSNKSYTSDLLKLKNNYRNRQLLSPVKSRFHKNNNIINNTSPKNDASFKFFDASKDNDENPINKNGINDNESIPQKFSSKTSIIKLDEQMNLIENNTDNFAENINNNFHNNINDGEKNNAPSVNGLNNYQNKKNKIKNTYNLTNTINEHSHSFISISNTSKQDNNEEQNNIEIKKALFDNTNDEVINFNYNKNNILKKKFQKKNTFNKNEVSNNIINNKIRNLHIEVTDNNESKTNTKSNFNKSQNNHEDKLVKELFSKYNKNKITANLNLIKNNVNLDLYNYSISPPDNRFILNAKINEIIEPPAKELLYDKKNIFEKNNRNCDTRRNISLRPSLNMQIFYGNYNDKKKEKIKKINYLSTSEQKFKLKNLKNKQKKIDHTFGKTIYPDYVKTEDLFTMTSYKK